MPRGANTASSAGSAYIFHRSGGIWTQQQKVTASDRAASDFFGSSVSISGDYAIVGAVFEDEDAARAIIHYLLPARPISSTASGTTWTEQQKIVASDRAAGDRFASVSISGDYVIVGAY